MLSFNVPRNGTKSSVILARASGSQLEHVTWCAPDASCSAITTTTHHVA